MSDMEEDHGADVLDLLLAEMDSDDNDGSDDSKSKAKEHLTDTIKVANSQVHPSTPSRQLSEVDLFRPNQTTDSKLVSSKDLFGDESDPEDSDYMRQTNLSDHGREIRKIMEDRQKSVTSSSFYDRKETNASIKSKWSNKSRVAHSPNTENVLREPLFNTRIINPKVSMSFMKSSAEGKEKIQLAYIAAHQTRLEKHSTNWVTVATIGHKSETKRSKQNDREFVIFRLVDMCNTEKEATLFLFGGSYQSHWKLPVGTVIGLQNPSVMKNDIKSNPRNLVTMSIKDASQLLNIGTSKDFGFCGAVTKAGNKCPNFVNKYSCDKCTYHAMREHKKAVHKRPEFNTAYGSRAPQSLERQMSVLHGMGKSKEDMIFYGGKTYSSKPAIKTKVTLNGVLGKSAEKGTLQNALAVHQIKGHDVEKITAAQNVPKSQAEKNLEELVSKPSNANKQFVKHLVNKEIKDKTKENGIKVKSISAAELLKQQKLLLLKQQSQKTLKSSSTASADIVLDTSSASTTRKSMSAAEYQMLKAKMIIKSQGGLKKENVNVTRKSLSETQKEEIKKRVDCASPTSEDTKPPAKKSRLIGNIDLNSPEVQAFLLKSRSDHQSLADQVMAERREQYFNTLEKKEGYEEKLLSTTEIDSVMFTCKQCNYTDWKLAERCKQERHDWKRMSVKKRHFKCNNCGERTVTHNRIPKDACKRCGEHNYSKCGLVYEKQVQLADQELSIRGNEESTLGNFGTKVDLNII